ncbi:DUF6616 family protein [Burkholderia pyrrocinia]|uniref:DUF6616 family protein n=1 Tax=Burkholderia pyrrocinia TaxID=60550 RepID=UPI000B6C0244|nr:hypothetical protein BZY94_10065 [Burkholderia territorii]HDR9504467.1 hypothetical protein [Burkholderia cepacia]
MKYYLVEHWSYKRAWLELDDDGRQAFIAKIGAVTGELSQQGIRTLGFGEADKQLDHAHKAFDFWSIWEMDTLQARDVFLAAVGESGWYEYFDHANTGGVLEEPTKVLASHLKAKPE